MHRMAVQGSLVIGFAVACLGCESSTSTPTPTPTPTPSPSTDMARPPSSSGDMATGGGGQTINVLVGPGGSMSFSPQTVSIHKGDTVLWTWDSGPHTVTSGTPGAADGKFCSVPEGTPATPATCSGTGYAKSPPFTYSETFMDTGTFPYYCTVHGATMTGTVTVQ